MGGITKESRITKKDFKLASRNISPPCRLSLGTLFPSTPIHTTSRTAVTPHANYIPIWLAIFALAQKVCYVRRNQSISRH